MNHHTCSNFPFSAKFQMYVAFKNGAKIDNILWIFCTFFIWNTFGIFSAKIYIVEPMPMPKAKTNQSIETDDKGATQNQLLTKDALTSDDADTSATEHSTAAAAFCELNVDSDDNRGRVLGLLRGSF